VITMEMALVEISTGRWSGAVFLIEIDPETDEPISPFDISTDGRVVYNEDHTRIIGERYASEIHLNSLNDPRDDPHSSLNNEGN